MTVESNTPEPGLDQELAAFAAILEPEKANREPREKAAQETEAEEADPAEQEYEAEESEREEGDNADDNDSDKQPETAKFEEVEIDGRKIKLSAADAEAIKPHLLRQQDYTRKTQEAAEIRKAAEAERQAAQQKAQEYTQGLSLVSRALQTFGPQPPDPSLLNEDPIEFVRQREAWQANQSKLAAVNQELARLGQHQQQQAEQESAAYRAEQAKRLPELIPAWKDQAKAQADQKLIVETLKSRGLDDTDIRHISLNASAEHIAILQEWASLKRLFAERQKAKPDAPKVAPAGPARQSSEPSQIKKARDAFRKSRGTDMAAADALFAQFLK